MTGGMAKGHAAGSGAGLGAGRVAAGVLPAPVSGQDPALVAVALAGQLREALGHAGISATVGAGFGMALVTAAGRVNVWVRSGRQGWHFRWWTGRVCEQTGVWDYAACPGSSVETAARRVGARVRQVCREVMSMRELGQLQMAAELAEAAQMAAGVNAVLRAGEAETTAGEGGGS